MTHSELDPVLTFGSGEICLLSLEAPYHLSGKMIKHMLIPGEILVISITRQGHAFMPLMGTEIRSGDILHLTVLASAMERIKELFGLGEGS
jgi:trk system potassium uptake protein TrkA